jgi:hypothetical protein
MFGNWLVEFPTDCLENSQETLQYTEWSVVRDRGLEMCQFPVPYKIKESCFWSSAVPVLVPVGAPSYSYVLHVTREGMRSLVPDIFFPFVCVLF